MDTAEIYSNGQSEKVIGTLLKKRGDLLVATKVSPENLGRQKLLKSIDDSLARLGIGQIDLYQIHWPNPKIPWSEIADALRIAHAQGKIRRIGICNVSLAELKEFEKALAPLKISAVQAEYNLFDRSVEVELLPYCQQSGKAFLAYSPLLQGQLSSSSAATHLSRLVAQTNLTSAQIVLAWLMSKPGVLPLPKALSERHVRENASSQTIALGAEILAEIDRVFAFNPTLVSPREIKVVQDGLQSRQAYSTAEEAVANALGLTPSPLEIAEQFKAGNFLKPVRVRLSKTGMPYRYELIEGRLRYWGWVLAFGSDKFIPVLIHG